MSGRGGSGRATVAGVMASLLAILLGAQVEAAPVLYVRTFGSAIAVVDAANPAVLARVPLGLDGSGAVVHPSGAFVYAHAVLSATRFTRDERVAVIDVASRTVVATIPVATGVRQLALDPAGAFLYVASDTSVRLSGVVVSSRPVVEVIDARTSRSVATVPLGPALTGPDHSEVTGMAVHPGGAKVYAARSVTTTTPSFQTTEDIVVIGAAPHAIVGTVPGLGAPLALDPVGTRLYVRAPGGIAVIDTATDTLVKTIPLACCLGSGHLTVHPNGGTVYALLPGLDGSSGQIAVVDARANALVTTISLGSLVPRAAAFHPDGSRLYVVGDAGETCQQLPCPPRVAVLAVVDTAANGVVATVALGPQPTTAAQSIAVHPAGTHVYAASPGGVAGTVAIVDAAANALVRTLPGVEVTIGPDLPRAPGGLRFHVARSADGSASAVPWGAGGDRPVPADYDGDGRADVAVLRPSEGAEESVWYVVRSSDGGVVRQQWGAVSFGDEPVPADYDGDGRADLAVWRPVDGTARGVFYVLRSSDGVVVRHESGSVDHIPVPADYDGDGRADFAVWRPAFTQWSIVGSAKGQLTALQFGAPTDVPVPADYDGDGRADIAVWRPTTGEWFAHLSATGAETSVAFGAPGDVPVPRDYDGDGRADFAVWRPRTGEWFILRSRDGAVSYAVWGAPGDRPFPSDYDGDGTPDLTVHRP